MNVGAQWVVPREDQPQTYFVARGDKKPSYLSLGYFTYFKKQAVVCVQF